MSQIEDTDFAAETANLIQSQILSQGAMAALQYANRTHVDQISQLLDETVTVDCVIATIDCNGEDIKKIDAWRALDEHDRSLFVPLFIPQQADLNARTFSSNRMRRHSTRIVCVCAVFAALASPRALRAQVTWNIDNTSNIGGNAVAAVVGSPTVVSTPFGDGLRFDGNDGVIVDANPVAGAASFTIEMLFHPDPIANATSNQPRILHVQSSIPPDHRATLEGRIENGQWYLDAFLRSQRPGQANASVVNNLTLIDPTKLHALGQWYNFAMTYDGAQLRAYLNGVLELEGPLAVLATAPGQVSLGMRHNRVNLDRKSVV